MAARYTASVVGAGTGGRLSIQALRASDRFDLVAVTDISEEARSAVEQAHPDVRTFADHGSMLDACPTDVVCVSTWPPSHLEITRDAVSRPIKGLLLEKPLADTHADGAEALRLLRDRDLPVVVPHGLLVADHARRIRELVSEGAIGDLKLISIECSGWDIINAGIHWLNFAIALLPGDPFQRVLATCDASTRTYRDGVQVETIAVTSVQTASGVRVVMHTGDYVRMSSGDPEGTLFRLIGTRGQLDFYGWMPAYRILNGRHPQGERVDITPGPRTGHQRHLEALADQMDKGTPDYAVAESSLAALELVEAAYVSSRHRCTVDLPLSDFQPPQPPDWDPGRPYSGKGGGRDGRHLPVP